MKLKQSSSFAMYPASAPLLGHLELGAEMMKLLPFCRSPHIYTNPNQQGFLGPNRACLLIW